MTNNKNINKGAIMQRGMEKQIETIFKSFENLQENEKPKLDSYHLSYPALEKVLKGKKEVTDNDFIVLAHAVYGWMPTVLDMNKEDKENKEKVKVEVIQDRQDKSRFKLGAELLTKARTKDLTPDELKQLKVIVNNSIVGVSKLLHFTNPERYPIWDSKIYQFVLGDKAAKSTSACNKVGLYKMYCDAMHEVIKKKEYEPHSLFKTEKDLGYEASKLRAVELNMFHMQSQKDLTKG